jgi:hypothetical protein
MRRPTRLGFRGRLIRQGETGEVDQAGRNFVPDGLCSLKINDQLEFGRLLNGKVSRLGASQHLDQQLT